MKIDGNDIRPGMVIQHQSRLWRATKIQHTQPGKGGAYAQVELKDLRDGTKLNQRFRSSEKVERAVLQQESYQFLFVDNNRFTFMNSESFEQLELDTTLISVDQKPFLKEGVSVIIESYENQPLGIQLPDTMVFKVMEADAVVKGQTASSSYKPALLENNIKILVPPHIDAGTDIVVNTSDRTYVERAKE